MADAIKVTMEPTNFKSAPGGSPVTVRLTIQNAGSIVDQYTLELSDLPPDWYTLPRSSVALFPQDHDAVTFQIHPPAGIATRAGTYPFTVSVISQSDSRQSTKIPATLVVSAVDAFEMDMVPRKAIGRKVRYKITVRNGGNTDQEVVIEAIDPEEAIDFHVSEEEVHLEPGQKTTVTVTVKPRRGGWFGQRKEYRFEVKAKPGQAAAKTIQGQIVHKPRMRSFRPIRRILFWGVILGALAYAFFAFGQVPGINSRLGPAKKPVFDWFCVKLNMLCGTMTPTVTATPAITFTPAPNAAATAYAAGTAGAANAAATATAATANANATAAAASAAANAAATAAAANAAATAAAAANGNASPGPHNGTPVSHHTPTPQAIIVHLTPIPTAKPTVPSAPTFTPIPTSTSAPSATPVPTDTPFPTSTVMALPTPAIGGSPAGSPSTKTGALLTQPRRALLANGVLAYGRRENRMIAPVPPSSRWGLGDYSVS